MSTHTKTVNPATVVHESGENITVDSILTSEIISLLPHAHFAVCTHGDWPDLSAVSERYHVIL